MAEVPASLKSIKKYLEQGKTVDNPVVAYHCRLWALQQAMNMRSKLPKEDMGFIMTLMDEVEKEKGGLDLDDASMQCEMYAQDLFTKADDADRNGQSTLPTAKVFLAAAQIYEVCEQFGELPTDVVEKNKYAKWRFVEICRRHERRRRRRRVAWRRRPTSRRPHRRRRRPRRPRAEGRPTRPIISPAAAAAAGPHPVGAVQESELHRADGAERRPVGQRGGRPPTYADGAELRAQRSEHQPVAHPDDGGAQALPGRGVLPPVPAAAGGGAAAHAGAQVPHDAAAAVNDNRKGRLHGAGVSWL